MVESEVSHSHPYVPRNLDLPGFVPLVLSESTIIGVYGLSALLIATLIWILSGLLTKKTKFNRFLMCWWTVSGFTHLLFDGYIVVSPEFYKDNTAFYFAEVWRVYCKCDSRYVIRDAGVLTVSVLSAFVAGPASFIALYAIATGKSYSYILQFATSLWQLCLVSVYFISTYLKKDNFASSPYHYYAYFIGANTCWIIIPTIITIWSWKKICAAFQLIQGQKKSKLG
ncbi:Sterol-8,7-isomerase [Quillaja saponaria]|uniref:Sterol-8,7-isomerase n=1 Tax=Quillaja saponaria TaxID=32244 RepID=A0AAD7VFH6_QUISA|nr:Sterol-8,7-isomerase [Quillaja saponaria]